MLTCDSAGMGRIENSESFIGWSVTTGEVQCGSRDGPVPAGESESAATADAGRGGGVGRVLATAAAARRPPRERFGLGRTRPAALYLWYCGCTARISGWWGFHARSCVRLDDRGLAAVSLASPGAPGAGRIAPCAQAQASQSCSLLWWRCGDLCRAF